MTRSRRPWRKSRTFGDIYGGRNRRRNTDNIFARLHSLSAPGPLDECPIVVADNPSRDFLFPADGSDLISRCRQLPAADTSGLTHLWLRRVNNETFARGVPLAEFVCGSGVRAVILYPWRTDLTMRFGPRRPSDAQLRHYARWSTDLRRDKGGWSLAWTREAARDFTLDYLLLHEIGHHVDQYRNRWSEANRRATEQRADQYAVRWDTRSARRLDH